MTQHSPCYSAVSSSLTNFLPDCSNYSPFWHTHYHVLGINTALVLWTLYQATPLETMLHCCSALLQNLVGNSGIMQCLEEAEQKAEASVDVPPPLQIVILVPFCIFSLYLYPLSAPFSILSLLPFLNSPRLSTFPSFFSD